MLVTALNSHIGYDKAAEVAKKAYKDAKKSIEKTRKKLDAALRKAGVDPKQFEV